MVSILHYFYQTKVMMIVLHGEKLGFYSVLPATDNCILCNKPFSEGKTIEVDGGLSTVILSRKRRGDGIWEWLDGVTSVKVHQLSLQEVHPFSEY